MKKIVFINPPLSMKKRYGCLSFFGSTLPSLGLLWLAAVAREAGYQVKIIETSSLGLGWKETLKKILDFTSDYVAFTATTLAIYSAAKLAKSLKAERPEIKVLIGGPHITALPLETMRMFPEFDVGILGEGEETLKELLKSTSKSIDLRKIKGLIFKENEEMYITEKRPFIKEIDKLPFPAWDLLADFPNKYRPVATRFRRLPAASLVTTRGCPNRCVFCDRSIFGNVCRSFTPEYTFEMIEILYFKYGVREILFEDYTFFIFKNNIRAVCELILKNKLDISWSCLGRVDMIDTDLLKLMKKAGCWQIGYGIESGSQKILDFMRKNITLTQIRKAVQLTKKAGIQVKGFFILGFPLETESTIRETANFVNELDLDDITVNQFTPLPGSEIYKTVNQYGAFNNDWRLTNLLESVFIPKGLLKKDLIKYWKIIIRKFLLRPRIIIYYLKKSIIFLALRFKINICERILKINKNVFKEQGRQLM